MQTLEMTGIHIPRNRNKKTDKCQSVSYEIYEIQWHPTIVFSIPLGLSTAELIPYLKNRILKSHRLIPCYTDEKTLTELKSHFIVLNNPHKSLNYYHNQNYENISQPTEKPDFKALLKHISMSVPNHEKIVLPYYQALEVLLKKPNTISNLQSFTIDGRHCIYYPDEYSNSAYIYYNTIPEVQNNIPYKHLYFGYHYDTAFDITLPILAPIGSEVRPLYIIESKCPLYIRNSFLKKLRSFSLSDIPDMFRNYKHRTARGLFTSGISDIYYSALQPTSCLYSANIGDSLLIYDIVSNRPVFAMGNQQSDPELISTLESSDVFVTKTELIPYQEHKSILTTDCLYEFDNDTTQSIDLSGKNNKTSRETYNRVNKLIDNQEISLIIATNPEQIDKYQHYVSDLKDIWEQEWNERHKDATGYDKVQMSVDRSSYITDIWHILSTRTKSSLDCLLILVLDKNDNPIGYLFNIGNSDTNYYQAENCTLNKSTIRNLREYTGIREALYLKDKHPSQDVIIGVGYTDLKGLKEYKLRTRPISIYKLDGVRA